MPIVSAKPAEQPPLPSPLPTDFFLVPYELRAATHSDHQGLGTFATERVQIGTICIVFGGFVTPGDVFAQLPPRRQQHSFQVGDDLFMVCNEHLGPGDHVNHSCDPSLWFDGEITLLARRDIEAGEQLSFDYATCDSQPYDEFECSCGTDLCRGTVTGSDWKRPELHERYAGHFLPYLQRRIDARSF